jgi:hypothetical protein
VPPEELSCKLLGFSFSDRKENPVPCKIHSSLTEAWSVATEQFSAATKALTGDHIGTMSREDYMAFRRKAEEARLASENARMFLELHREEHGC